MEVEDVGGFGVGDQSDRPLLGLFLLPHLSGDVVAVAELVREAFAGAVKEETSLTAESWTLSATNTPRKSLKWTNLLLPGISTSIQDLWGLLDL